MRDQKKKALKMSDFGNSSPNPNLFAELSWRQLSFDFDLDAVACGGDEAQDDYDGHITAPDQRLSGGDFQIADGGHRQRVPPAVRRLCSGCGRSHRNSDLTESDA